MIPTTLSFHHPPHLPGSRPSLDTPLAGRYSAKVEERSTGTDDSVYEALRAILLRVVRRSCPAWLVSQRDDIVQAALTRIHRQAERGIEIADLKSAYVSRIAYNAVIDEIRYHRRRKALETVGTEQSDDLRSETRTPEEESMALELGRAVKACLDVLAKSRNVAVSLYLGGSGITEIASAMGWKRKQADNLVYRGLADMRTCLARKGISP